MTAAMLMPLAVSGLSPGQPRVQRSNILSGRLRLVADCQGKEGLASVGVSKVL